MCRTLRVYRVEPGSARLHVSRATYLENEKAGKSPAFSFVAGWRMLAGGRWLLQRAGESWLASRTR